MTVSVLGVWTLHAYHDLDERGNASIGPLGQAPRGLLTYQSDGRMAVAMMRTEPAPSDLEHSAGLLPPMSPPEEFMSYSGTWRLEGDRRSSTRSRSVCTRISGAGLYAALGAVAASTAVEIAGLVSDDVSEPVVAQLPVGTSGLVRAPGRRLRFDISYDAAGHATYTHDLSDVEELITPHAVLAAAPEIKAAHLCPTGCPRIQAEVSAALRARGWWLSATTFGDRILNDPSQVQRLIRSVDVLVCSASDALLLTHTSSLATALRALTPGWVSERPRIVCVTDAEHGAHLLLPGHEPVTVPARPVQMVDPTGAGESFAGALAASLHHAPDMETSAIPAARVAADVAATTVSGWGPHALLDRLRAHSSRPPTGDGGCQ